MFVATAMAAVAIDGEFVACWGRSYSSCTALSTIPLCLHGVVAMVAVPSGYKLVISRATLGMHGIYCTQPSGMRPRASVQ